MPGRELSLGAVKGGIGIADEYWNWLRKFEEDGLLRGSFLILVCAFALLR